MSSQILSSNLVSHNNSRGLILASSSPRRLQLLAQINIPVATVVSPNVEEAELSRELPRFYALRVARSKALSVADKNQGQYVLAADTVVACGRRILPKAEQLDVARSCLVLLSGRRHRVFTAVVIVSPCSKVVSRIVETRIKFKKLNEDEIRAYLSTNDWHGKAGGYAIQGVAASFISWIGGSYTNVVGLPLYETRCLLEGLGWQWNKSEDSEIKGSKY